MSPRSEPADHSGGPEWSAGDSALGLVLGWTVTIIVGATIVQTFADDPTAPVGFGARVGRVGLQTALGQTPTQPGLPLWMIAVLQALLWIGLLFGVGRAVGVHRVELRRDLRLDFDPQDVPIGVAAGVGTQLLLVPLLYVPIFWIFGDQDVSGAARDLTSTATSPIGIILLTVVVVIGAPVVEELFFRGLVLRTIESRTGIRMAIWASALLFAAVHFQLLQFPALALFGLVAAALAVRAGRLGPAIVAHIAFNATSVVVLLA